jgi:6-phosphogluconolactonase
LAWCYNPVVTSDLQIVSAETTLAVFAKLSEALCRESLRAVQERNTFFLALSGGTTPEPLYRDLARRTDFPWQKTQVFIVDERCVPEDDPRSNFRMLHGALVATGALQSVQLHSMNATAPDAATEYERLLRQQRPDGCLDAVLLGMGSDGHTASLFPNSEALNASHRWVLPNDGPTVVQPARITMTAPFINKARWVGALVVGDSKRTMLNKIFTKTVTPTDAPIRLIAPASGLTYYIDAPADPRPC